MSAHDLDLMQHADGEATLTDGELDLDARAKVEAIHHLGAAVRGTTELAADAVPEVKFTAMLREIDKLLDNEAASKAKTAERALQTAAETRPVEREPRGWVGRWFERARGYVIAGVVGAGAVAVVVLVTRTRGDDPAYMNGGGPIDVRPASLRAPVDIESLDTPNGQGTVLNLEDEDGHTTVIWVSPADTVENL